MGVNARLVGIVIFFAVLGGALWWMLGDKGAPSPPNAGPAIAKRATAPEPVVESTAPAPVAAAPSKPAAPAPRRTVAREPDKPKKSRTGDGTIIVSVVTTQGQSVAGANVMLELDDWKPEEEPGDDILRFEVVSGADGTYTFTDVIWGEAETKERVTGSTLLITRFV